LASSGIAIAAAVSSLDFGVSFLLSRARIIAVALGSPAIYRSTSRVAPTCAFVIFTRLPFLLTVTNFDSSLLTLSSTLVQRNRYISAPLGPALRISGLARLELELLGRFFITDLIRRLASIGQRLVALDGFVGFPFTSHRTTSLIALEGDR